MSDKPSAAWYLAPIFLGIIGSVIMWFVLKDEEHPDSQKMIKKGWIIGIVLTIIPFLIWIPMMAMMPFVFMGVNQQPMQQQVPEQIQQQPTFQILIGIVLTIIPFLIWIPMMAMMPFVFMGVNQQPMQQQVPEQIQQQPTFQPK